jgi:Beta-ketoacyl synthase, N-terminal domain
MIVNISGAAILGPGITDWPAFQALCAGTQTYQHAATVLPPSTKLPPAERRRVGLSVKVGLATAEQLFALNPHTLASDTASIFTSSGGDGDNCHILCSALTETPVMLSPTRFTNSVHNAPAGYYGIAHQAVRPSNSICARDGSFVAGLLEAASYVICEGQAMALVAYDVPYPEPLNGKRYIAAPFGIALLLTPAGVSTPGQTVLASITIDALSQSTQVTSAPAPFEALRRNIPAARALPLLAALIGPASTVVLDAGDGSALSVRVQPKA